MSRKKRQPKKRLKASKPKVGRCQDCGEHERLRAVGMMVDGRQVGKTRRLCRSCAACTAVRFGSHPAHGGWPR